MRRPALAAVPLLFVMTACGGHSSAIDAGTLTYSDAADAASGAGLNGCQPNTDSLASGAIDCTDTKDNVTAVDSFKSVAAEQQWKNVADSVAAGGVILYGDRWAIECATAHQCTKLEGVPGGVED